MLTSSQRAIVDAIVRDVLTSLPLRLVGAFESWTLEHARQILERRASWHTDESSGWAFVDELVQEVQQRIHDEHIHTTWPRCPRHSNHPLWLKNQHWCCPHDDEPIARLGGLQASDSDRVL